MNDNIEIKQKLDAETKQEKRAGGPCRDDIRGISGSNAKRIKQAS